MSLEDLFSNRFFILCQYFVTAHFTPLICDSHFGHLLIFSLHLHLYFVTINITKT